MTDDNIAWLMIWVSWSWIEIVIFESVLDRNVSSLDSSIRNTIPVRVFMLISSLTPIKCADLGEDTHKNDLILNFTIKLLLFL